MFATSSGNSYSISDGKLPVVCMAEAIHRGDTGIAGLQPFHDACGSVAVTAHEQRTAATGEIIYHESSYLVLQKYFIYMRPEYGRDGLRIMSSSSEGRSGNIIMTGLLLFN